jgi:hypothetical protein
VRSLGRPSRQVVAASFLLVTLIAWHVEAIAGQLTLTWINSSTNEFGFSVERSTGTMETFGEIETTGPGVTTYTDLTVADDTPYCYRVRAFDATAYSGYSNVACATPLTVTLSLNETTFSNGDGLTLSADIHVNFAFSNPVDAYLDAQDPFGSIHPVGSYVNADMPSVGFSGVVAAGALTGLPAGTYTLWLVLVKAGGDPQNLGDRLSNLASISFVVQ